MTITPQTWRSWSGLLRREWQCNVVRVAQLTLFAVAGLAAFEVRFDFAVPTPQIVHLRSALLIWLLLKPIAFECFGLTRRTWRFVSVGDVLRLAYANVAASTLGALALIVFVAPGFPRSIYFIDFAFSLLLTAGARIAARLVAEGFRSPQTANAERVFLYGAGSAGVMLLRELHANPSLYNVCGLIDDDPTKLSTTIHDVRVLGSGGDLRELASRFGVHQALIAAPSSSVPEMARILQYCHEAGVRCRTIPKLSEIISGRALASQVREVAVEDLLGRMPVTLDEERILDRLGGRSVVVTGAAGSIGSEICRQLAHFRPSRIIGYDISETALFYLEREMHESYPHVQFVPEIGNIQHLPRIAEVFSRYSPALVYHAAAYKHVPLMEEHLFEAVENNVVGTYNVATAAAEYGVEDFVMISSDKAVHPTSIMGVTKRTAELLINSMQNGASKYVSVRFGNVLGSNGSVVPLFKKQISEGGPVKVTSPEMRRYFMTIPEAAQLVLQASIMGQGGEIFVLDMGEPVRIVDLARNLIQLSGLTPDKDIKIVFTGIRPGEKLYEELSTLEENTRPTFHKKIKIFVGNGLPQNSAAGKVDRLRRLCRERDAQSLLLELKGLVPDYNPSSVLLQRMFGRTREVVPTRPAVLAHAAAKM